MKYQWTSNMLARPYGDSSSVVEHLEHLRSQDELTKERIIQDAKNPRSPLYGHITFDKELALYRYQRIQVGKLMGSLVKTNGTSRRIYMRVPGKNGEPGYYDLVSRVLRSPELRRPYARRALLEMQGWDLRYGDFPELQKALRALKLAVRTVVRPALKEMETAGT